MTNPFTGFAFAATGEPTNRTLPARLADIKNVKDFGATGDGVTDDWAAIMAAVNWTTSSNRGLIYFPPGTYSVSQPIDFLNGGTVNEIANIIFRGELGLSSVVGNFSDYVFKRATTSTAGDSGVHGVECLTVINNNATGGGIRIGFCVGAYVRDCIVTANLGINTASDDIVAGVTSQEVSIENCTLSPGANASGSLGIMSVSDGPIVNCSIIGFSKGIIGWGQQGAQNILGCHIELCGVGVDNGANPAGAAFNPGMRIAGCHFKNCGTAVNNHSGALRMFGVRIDAAEGTIAGNPQYGINTGAGMSFYTGIRVTGQYAQYAINVPSGNPAIAHVFFFGVQAFNTSSLVRPAWSPMPTAVSASFINCNIPPVYTMIQLPAFPLPISTISWAGGTTTINFASGNIGQLATVQVTVAGVTPSGYNGVFNATVTNFNQVTYTQSNPGASSGTGGTAIVLPPDAAQEGDSYNVSDSNVSTWGSNPVGGGSTPAKVRWSGSNWSVVGV